MVITGARVVLACLFLATGLSKLAYLGHFARAVSGYRVVPDRWVPLIALLLPTTEVFVGLCLFFGSLAPWPEISAGVLLTTFSAAVVTTLVRSRPRPACGCFARGARSEAPVGYRTVFRNLVLISVAALGAGAHDLAPYARSTAVAAGCALVLVWAIPRLVQGINGRRSA